MVVFADSVKHQNIHTSLSLFKGWDVINLSCVFWQVLKEDITPTLNKLRDERSSYLEYQKILRELEHLSKLYVAYQFVCAEVLMTKSFCTTLFPKVSICHR